MKLIFTVAVILLLLIIVVPVNCQPQLLWSLENEEIGGEGLGVFAREGGGTIVVGRSDDYGYYTVFHLFDSEGNHTSVIQDNPENEWHNPVAVTKGEDGEIILGCRFSNSPQDVPQYLTVRRFTTEGVFVGGFGVPDLLGGSQYTVDGFACFADGNYVVLVKTWNSTNRWLARLSEEGEVLELRQLPEILLQIKSMELMRDGRLVIAAGQSAGDDSIFWTFPWSLEIEESVSPQLNLNSWGLGNTIALEESRFAVVVREGGYPATSQLYIVDPTTGEHGLFREEMRELHGGVAIPGSRMLLAGAQTYDTPELTQIASTGEISWQAQHHAHWFAGVSRWYRTAHVTKQNELLAVGSSYIDWGTNDVYYVYGAKYSHALPPTMPSLEILPHFVAPDIPQEGGTFPFTIWIDGVSPAEHEKTLIVTLTRPDGTTELVVNEEILLPPCMSDRVGPWEVSMGVGDPPGDYWIRASLDSAGVVLAGDQYRVQKALPDRVDIPGVSIAASTSEVSIQSVVPNPFNVETSIYLVLPQPAVVRAVVVNVLGQHVATLHDGVLGQGVQPLRFDGSELPSGSYTVVVEEDGSPVCSQRVVLVK